MRLSLRNWVSRLQVLCEATLLTNRVLINCCWWEHIWNRRLDEWLLTLWHRSSVDLCRCLRREGLSLNWLRREFNDYIVFLWLALNWHRYLPLREGRRLSLRYLLKWRHLLSVLLHVRLRYVRGNLGGQRLWWCSELSSSQWLRLERVVECCCHRFCPLWAPVGWSKGVEVSSSLCLSRRLGWFKLELIRVSHSHIW